MATTSETPTKRRRTKAAADADMAQEQSITEAWNAGDDFASEPAVEQAAAPKRTRKKKTDEPVAEAAPATEEDAVEAVAAEAKPRRTRKKATEETAEVVEATPEPAEAVAEPVAEAAPVVEEAEKPKRSRKKAETDEAPKSLLEIAGEKPSTKAADAAPQVAEAPEPEVETPITFADLGMSESLMKSITAVGYEEPTPIQRSTIPLLLEVAMSSPRPKPARARRPPSACRSSSDRSRSSAMCRP